jgi:Flp pilus assembly protein TadG
MNPLKRFKAECKGSVAIMFAVAVLPILVASGMAIDYSRAVSRRTTLQNALDGALMAASRMTGNQTDAQLKPFILSYIQGSGFSSVTASDISLSRDGQTLIASVDTNVDTTLMSLAGIPTVDIKASTRATWGDAEVVLVLDSSETMGSSRLAMLQTAALSFVDQAGGTASGSIGGVDIGLVPYAISTRVPANGSYNGVKYKDAPWILFSGGSFDDTGKTCTGEDGEDGEDGSCTTFSSVTKSSWEGCLNDRLWDLDTNDIAYGGENHAKYPARTTCRSGEKNNLQTVFPLALPADNLANHLTSLKTHINGMKSGGGANMTIGVAWGHAMLSSHDPFIGGANPTTRRIIILVAASANSGAHVWSSKAVADGRTQMACTSAKTAGIEIFTVSLSLNATNDTLLQTCATDTAHFFDATSASDINAILSKIALQIRTPRLTH